MKALTLWQPWASLLACGTKKYETRSWATSYRGPIAIHAAKKPFDTSPFFDKELHLFAEALNLPDIYNFDGLPYGCVIATAELVGCYQIYDTGEHGAYLLKNSGKVEFIRGNEIFFGDWTEGRFAWEFVNVTILPEPVPAKGKQGFWNWEGAEQH